jgi:hypothetical protein
MDLTAIFCLCDDFYKSIVSEIRPEQTFIFKKQYDVDLIPNSRMTIPEIMTIILRFHLSGYHDLKHFFLFVSIYWRHYFPQIVSYSRFIELLPSAAFFLNALLVSLLGKPEGDIYIDSSAIAVCKNKRIYNHKVFRNLAQRGKTSIGWFFGFKIHLVINSAGEILNFAISPGNTHDLNGARSVLEGFSGTIFGDKGYIGKDFFEEMLKKGIKIVTSIRASMRPQIMSLAESESLSRRSLIESVFNVLKNSCRMEHSRHRSPKNFMSNLLGSLCAYMLRFVPGITGKNLLEA